MNPPLLAFLTLNTALTLAAFTAPAQSQPPPAATESDASTSELFRPFEILVGEWDVRATDDRAVAAIIRVRWGPNHSYLWYASSLLFDGHEEPHLEGMLVWNAVHKNLDMLFSMDLRTGKVQEQGTMSAQADGTIVREITAIYGEGAHGMGMPPIGPEGATAQFRETYKKISDDKILTSAMRKTKTGWVATFPGSDHLVMTRRSG